jgi:glycosyltransferase involved in cell wall biosynthesis
MLAASHVLVVIQPGTHLQVPVKLYEYMPFRKPILALAPHGAVSDLIDGGRLGMVVPPDDPGRIEDALSRLYADRHRLSERYPADEHYVRQFDGAAVSERLQQIIEQL